MNQSQPSTGPVYTPYRQTKKIAPADKKDAIFLILTFATLFLVVDFGFACGMNLGFTIAYAALFATATAYFVRKGSLKPLPVLCGILSLALCPVFALYHDLLNAVTFITIFLLFSVYIGGCSGILYHGTRGFRLLYDCIQIYFYYPIAHITAPFDGLKAARGEGENKKRGNLTGVIIGLLACIPVLCVVIPLLVSSDAAFAGLVGMLFKRIGITLLHLFFALLLTPLLYGLFYALRHKLTAEPVSTISSRFIDNAVVCGFFGLLSAVYLVYLFSQLAYFFSAFGSVLPEEFTAADYARRGFFELCAISLINLFLMFCAFTLVKKPDPAADIPKSSKGFGIFLCCFNLVLVGTAVSKMVLYIERFGLTRLRILTTVFMVMMGVLFLCLIARLIRRRFPYMAVSLAVCVLIGGAVLYADMNTVIANYNVDAYLSGRLDSIDLNTLEELEASAVPALTRLYREANDGAVRTRAFAILSDQKASLKPAEDFRYYNFTTARALKTIASLDFDDDYYYSSDPKIVSRLFSDRYFLLDDGSGKGMLCVSRGEYRYEILLDDITGYNDYNENFIALQKKGGSCYIFNAATEKLTGPSHESEIESKWKTLNTYREFYWYEID